MREIDTMGEALRAAKGATAVMTAGLEEPTWRPPPRASISGPFLSSHHVPHHLTGQSRSVTGIQSPLIALAMLHPRVVLPTLWHHDHPEHIP
jgi:hypothetical protein